MFRYLDRSGTRRRIEPAAGPAGARRRGLVAQLLQLAAAVGFALVVAIVVGAAFVALILHG